MKGYIQRKRWTLEQDFQGRELLAKPSIPLNLVLLAPKELIYSPTKNLNN